MIDFNNYQASLYKKLKEIKLDGVNQLSIYDKVQANAKLPFVIVGNYEFDEGEVKDYTYSIVQNLEIWSDYQGKKEINSIVKLAIEKAKELASEELNGDYMIDAVTVMPSTVKEVEGFFSANVMVKFDIY